MNDEPSLISMHPFFRKFVLAVIHTIREREGISGQKFVVDTDMIPKGSEAVLKAAMEKAPVVVNEMVEVSRKPEVAEVVDDEALIAPIRIKKVEEKKVQAVPIVEKKVVPVVERTVPQKIVLPAAPVVQENVVPVVAPEEKVIEDVAPVEAEVEKVELPIVEEEVVEEEVNPEKAYSRIVPLLGDPSVSTIECLGAGKELMVVRAGQKQKTRIKLNGSEIRGVLDKVAEDAHIPLMDGIFRASLSDFAVNAVVSEMVGSRFVIKKNTAYNLLE